MNQEEKMQELLKLSNQNKYTIKDKFDVCHYTNSIGLLGILKSKSIWFTEKGFLNDIAEEKYWSLMVKEAIDKKLTVFNLADNAKIIEEVNSFLNRKDEYVFSMTTEIDSIHEWTYYGKEDGYALVFDKDKLSEALQIFDIKMAIGFVNYDKDYQKKLLDFLVESYINMLILNKLSSEKHDSEIISIKEKINYFTSFFKQPEHRVENEIRSIIHCSEKAIEYRIRKGIFTPYTQFGPLDLPIKQIIIGPGIEKESAQRGLSNLLKSLNYKDIEVKYSELEIR